jgi:general secretion pathway protein N
MIKALLRGPYVFSALLAAGIVLALVAIGLEADWGRASHSVAKGKRMAPAQVADAGLLPAFSLGPIDQVSPQSGERPLFVPTRRPAPVVALQASTMRKGQFLLQGTSITKDFGDVAMLKEVANNRAHVVRKGGQLNGITVDKIEPGRVLLKQGDETEELAMKTQGPAKIAPPAPITFGSIFQQIAPPSPPPAPATSVPKPPGTAAAPATSPPTAGQAGQAAAPKGAPPAPMTFDSVFQQIAPQAASIAPATAVPQPEVASQTPLTPEEVLARRRAARSQQTQ